MHSERLLQTAFEACRFLTGSLPHAVSDHIAAIDPDASEDSAFLLVQADSDEGYKILMAALPENINVMGCQVSIICKPSEFACRMN